MSTNPPMDMSMGAGLGAPAPAGPAVGGGLPIYRPLGDKGASFGERLEQMLTEGRRVVSQERFRHQRNREAYRGNTYLQPISVARQAGHLARLAPAEMLPSGRRRDSINRLRQMVDGRIAMLTRSKPPHEAIPANRERATIDAARVATRIVDFQWDNVDGWNIAAFWRRLALWGDQDGVAFANVLFDRSRGERVPVMMEIDPETGQPRIAGVDPQTGLVDRGKVEALLEQDPNGEHLWFNEWYQTGEVVFRTVRAGALAFDPAMTTDWRDASWVIEGRRRKIVDLEREYEVDVRKLVKLSDAAMGRQTRRLSGGYVQPEDGSLEQSIDPQREVMVYELFHKATGPTGEWPIGAHVVWVQDAPGRPIVEEPWLWPNGEPRDLPYYPYIPRPDGGHILRTLGTVDELLPVQRQFDRRLSQYGDWLDLVSQPPLLLVGGSLRSKAVYNKDRIVHVNPGFEAPRFMQVPPDPGIALMQVLQFLENQMGEIAIQSGPVRGQALPGVEAAATYNSLIQQGEGQLAGTEAQGQEVLQWAVSQALKNVVHYYTIPRTLTMPGVDDQAELQAFTGARIAGVVGWRITGSLLPKNRAAQLQMLERFMQYSAGRFDPTPYAAEILEGDIEAVVSMERLQTRKQERENDLIAAIGNHPDRDRIWEEFTAMRDAYSQALQMLSRQMRDAAMESGMPPMVDPLQVMREVAPPPPRVTDMLRAVGIHVPEVAITDRDPIHIRALEAFMTNDAFDSMHPLVQELAREHLNEHLQQQSTRVMAMASQMPPAMAAGMPAPAAPAAPADEQPQE